MTKSHFFLLFITVLIAFASCKDDEPIIEKPTYTIPTTYDFNNVSYSGQTQRIGQFSEMKNYMGTSKTQGTALDIAKLLAMYENDSANAGWTGTYEDSKKIKSKTFEGVQEDFASLLTELAIASQSTVAGSNGVSGVIQSLDGAKKYLIGDDGLDHAQVFEKGLMGALLFYQAAAVYMEPGKIDGDNETVTDGRGTEMEHAFDEAFGYFGVPIDFPTNTAGLQFWGNYSQQRNDVLGSNKKMMDAFLKGRAAITNKDLAARDEAIATIRKEWELIAVGSALHYLNGGIANFDDMSLMGHGISEAIGFVYSLKFNPVKTITNDQIDELLIEIAGSADFADMNLYDTTVARFQMAKAKLADWYDLNDKKDDF